MAFIIAGVVASLGGLLWYNSNQDAKIQRSERYWEQIKKAQSNQIELGMVFVQMQEDYDAGLPLTSNLMQYAREQGWSFEDQSRSRWYDSFLGGTDSDISAGAKDAERRVLASIWARGRQAENVNSGLQSQPQVTRF